MADLFRKPKKNIQPRKKVETEIEEEDDSSRVSDIRDLQKSRERKNGLTELECAVGISKAAALEDGIQMTGGGMVMTSKKKAAMEAASIEQGLREQFEKETMLRDEHEELRKFIDDGLNRQEETSSTSKEQEKFTSLTAEDRDAALLQRAAGRVKGNQSKKETELLSEHMLAGIPEVDLGISARITNILKTEKKKRFLLDKSKAIASGQPLPEEPEEPKRKHQRKPFRR
ncbi:unnamed protein product [Caenorhabditis angaria]|uniref:Uncharacterized protein n=1 Tax=Caenorhabditis angaria TaxID=860376 RepID=A0A9P1I4T0_9PELO|nr:unnamed protein product [Caenorhabditis angaria]